MHVLTCLHSFMHVLTCSHRYMHVLTCLHSYTRVLACLHTYMRVLACLHSYTRVLACLHSYTRVLACLHDNTCTPCGDSLIAFKPDYLGKCDCVISKGILYTRILIYESLKAVKNCDLQQFWKFKVGQIG